MTRQAIFEKIKQAKSNLAFWQDLKKRAPYYSAAAFECNQKIFEIQTKLEELYQQGDALILCGGRK